MGGLQIDSTPVCQTREEFAAQKLREAILLGHLKPGDKLDQNEIAELLGISRSPVRDALRTLAAEGLVEVIPHRGAAVAELSADEVEEIFLIRRILEGMAARLATQRIGPAQIAELQAVLDEIDQTSDLDGWLELNRRFHHTTEHPVVNGEREEAHYRYSAVGNRPGHDVVGSHALFQVVLGDRVIHVSKDGIRRVLDG